MKCGLLSMSACSLPLIPFKAAPFDMSPKLLLNFSSYLASVASAPGSSDKGNWNRQGSILIKCLFVLVVGKISGLEGSTENPEVWYLHI